MEKGVCRTVIPCTCGDSLYQAFFREPMRSIKSR